MDGNKMNQEYEKCMAGEIYDCHNEIFLEFKAKTRALLAEYHALKYEEKEKKREILSRMFGGIGKNVSVGQPFLCDYGCNIYIGNNVLISSNVQLYTSTHPVELSDRLVENWEEDSGAYFCTTYAKPITIGDGAWLGGGVIVLPGVTIGRGSVIGAGSVVTKSIPENVVAAGNPCRIIRKINEGSKEGIQQNIS